jgi:hypothetical protein
MRTTEQAVMSWGAAMTLLATTFSTLASEQALLPGSQAAPRDISFVEAGADGRIIRAEGGVSKPADANRTVPGDLYVEPSTLHCLGFEWNVEGDDNRNGRVEVRYRRPGEDAWHRALDLLRLHREQIAVSNPEWAWQCGNMYAGSVLFLDPGTVYEMRLTLLDPDHSGGDDSPQAAVVAEKRLRVATKTLPAIAPDGRRLHLYPHGFQGQRVEPAFGDFAAAYRETLPGDQILLHAGRYTFQAVLDKAGRRDQPIVIRAAGDGEVVLAGGGRTLDVSRAAYHWLEGLTFRDNQWPVYCDEQGRSIGLTVVRCRFVDNEVGVFLRSRQVRDVYIADNDFDGSRGTWHRQANRKHPYKAVWTNGQGVDVCYNTVHQHWDGLSINQPRQGVHESERKVCAVDFYGNDVGQITDDNESDGGQHNVRFFLNRLVDSHVGLSAQPFYGGPVYFVRNVQYNVTRGLVFKLNVEPAGVYILHNTSFTSGAVGTNITSGANVHVHNNLFLGCGGPALHAGVLDPAVSTWDYNGYTDSDDVQFKAPGHRPARSFRELQDKFGYEKHRVEVGFHDLVNVPLPQGEAVARTPQDFGDYRPRPGSRAVDAGMVLPNINDGFVGQAPDLGAIECGQPLPHFGPRPPDLILLGWQ